MTGLGNDKLTILLIEYKINSILIGGNIVIKTLKAVFENGVFKPLQKVHLKEHQEFEISISEIKRKKDAPVIPQKSHPIFNIINLFESEVSDLSLNHNSYLYSPKD
jgi:predicted DNA-binding antitoxin AbrB/MazE fold protein